MKQAWKLGYFAVALIAFSFFSASCASGTGDASVKTLMPAETVAIDFYIDPLCPHSALQNIELNRMKKAYGDKLQVNYNLFPVEPVHPEAGLAAQAAECARDQDKFAEMIDGITQNQKGFSAETAKKLAGNLKLDQATFDGCLDGGKKKDVVDAALQNGLQKGVTRTPTLFLFGRQIEGTQEAGILTGLINFETAVVANVDKSTYSEEMKNTRKIDVVEFGDFQCPYCNRANPSVKQLIDNYGSQINFSYKHFPLSFHNQAFKAAEASECARDQGMFIAYHDKLFDNIRALDVPNLKVYAQEVGLDADTFNNCLDSGAKTELIKADQAAGTKVGVSGTPSFLVGDELVVGAVPYETLKQAVELKLAGKPLGDIASPGDKPVDTSNDPEFTLTVVNDGKCAICNVAPGLNALKQKFPSAKVETVDSNDPAGKALIETNNISALPAFLFDQKVESCANFPGLKSGMLRVDAGYQLSPRQSRSVKFFDYPSADGGWVKGGKGAKITVTEYSDFQCPFCKRADPTVRQIMEKYGDKVQVAYKHFPLSFHQNAQKAAEASECAGDQGKFWEFHDAIFENQENIDIDSLKSYAGKLGLNQASFDDCLDSGKKESKVKDNFMEGQKYGVSGTPGFFVNEYFVSGAQPFTEFEKIIDSILQ